jgi:very-short-patch-repair endonuclease
VLRMGRARQRAHVTDPAPGGLRPGHSPGPEEVSMRSVSPFRPSPHRARVLGERASQMRHSPTSSEAVLFQALRGGRLGVAVRRQVPLLGRFIADLLVPEVRLVIEVDGEYHAQRRKADARRDRALGRAGYSVLRIEVELVMGNLPEAVERIRVAIDTLSRC